MKQQVMLSELKVGISACLLGDEVRYDGGHKRSAFCQDELGRHVQFVKLCPEVGIGMPVPRPTIRLERTDSHINAQAVVSKTGTNVTAALQGFADRAQPQLQTISGYVLCAKSPSCGMELVKVYDTNTGQVTKTGMGIFAARLRERYPALPLAEDGWLQDPHLRENFIGRVYVYGAWQALTDAGQRVPTKHQLLEFHAQMALLLMAHSQVTYRALGPWLAEQTHIDVAQATHYIEELMAALSQPASKAGHSNVLQHIQGYFKDDLTAPQQLELSELILAYRQGREPLFAPLTLIKHYQREFPKPYLATQQYLTPYPSDLRLDYGL